MSLEIGAGITLGAGVRIDPTYAIATDGLVVNLDASEFSSSPAAGATWTNTVTGPTFTLPNGATYSSDNGGILTFARSSEQSAHGTGVGSSLTTFTAETWVKFNTLDLTSGNATCTITEVYASTPINYTIGCGMLNNPNVWQGGYYGGNGDWHLAGTLTPVVNTWYCMTVTYDGTNIRFYVNGALNEATASAVTPASSGQGIHIGERWDAPFLPQSFLDGSIPVVRLYDRALSPTEVRANYEAARLRFVDLVTDGLIQNLDAGNPDSYNGTGITWSDLSAANNPAVLQGSTPWTSAGDQSYFTFSGGYANGGSILPNTAYTKIGIFRVAGNYLNIISGSDADQHAFWGAGTQYLNAGHNGAWATITSPITTPLNQWVFGAVTFNSSTGWKLYLNDNPVVTNGSTDQFSSNPALVEIGAFNNSTNLNGDVAVSLIYNRALSEAEIAQNFAHYQSRFGL